MRYKTLFDNLGRRSLVSVEDAGAVTAICERVPGWSGISHYAFFRGLFATLLPAPDSRARVLLLGVYRGRDLSFILHILNRYHFDAIHDKRVELIGVDRFEDAPCDDWKPEDREKSWEHAGFGQPPSLEIARANLAVYSPDCATLVKSDDDAYLRQLAQAEGFLFDAIYLDTSHDQATVQRQFMQCPPLLKADGIICGDDYLERPEWGVIQAVAENRPDHCVLSSCWAAPARRELNLIQK